MPICMECHGTGQVEKKEEIMAPCPHCDGTKRLRDGSECPHCNDWGEAGTGQYNVEMVICTTCWGSGRVSEQSLMVWFLVRAVPATILLVGGGLATAWAAWQYLDSPLAVTLVTLLFFGGWAALLAEFIRRMPDMGEISPTNWFLIRAIPTTVTALAIGGTVVWSSWHYLENAIITAVLALTAVIIWAVLMYFFISRLPE
ncbi:MAG: hypothetical protein D6784_12755 [Chloroflexi bacterium]|nr:MAG: hypothetical protein D6784_12755 [Chloroflexota bacterium]